MFRKILTHFIILTLTVLPVQLLGANVENISMQMSMGHSVTGLSTTSAKECLHSVARKSMATKTDMEKSCCDEQSHQCKSCNHCLHITTATILPSPLSAKIFFSSSEKFLVSHLSLNGIPQNNLLRPPRF